MSDVTHRKRGLRIWGFEKKRVEFLPRKKKVDFQSWARPDEFVRYGHRALFGLRADDVKAVGIEDCVSPSSCRKAFNSKVIKSFVPELSRKVLYFGFPMSISHIRVTWVFYMRMQSYTVLFSVNFSLSKICLSCLPIFLKSFPIDEWASYYLRTKGFSCSFIWFIWRNSSRHVRVAATLLIYYDDAFYYTEMDIDFIRDIYIPHSMIKHIYQPFRSDRIWH